MEHGPIKVGMVIVMQPDLKKAVEFYRDTLNLPLKFHLDDKWAEFDLGCVKFGLCPIGQKQDNIRTGVVLETTGDVQQMYKDLQGKVEFLSEPIVAVHGIMVGFKDPGGNVLDLYQATPEKMKEMIKKQKESEAAGTEKGCCCKGGNCACGDQQSCSCSGGCACKDDEPGEETEAAESGDDGGDGGE